jgi:hypothetical protein
MKKSGFELAVRVEIIWVVTTCSVQSSPARKPQNLNWVGP